MNDEKKIIIKNNSSSNDITSLLVDTTLTLTYGSPTMLHTSWFNLQDSMAALGIMDRMMD
jgi:hypothetical protein